MEWEAIRKPTGSRSPALNMVDFELESSRFSWASARQAVTGLPGGAGLNIAHEAVDRHASGAAGQQVALRCLLEDGRRANVTYAELAERSNRFANVLDSLGVQAHDRVFALLPRVPDLHSVVIGTLKHRAVFCPLFSGFGPAPLSQRLETGGGRVLVTTSAMFRQKVQPIRSRLASLTHVLVTGASGSPPPGTLDLDELMGGASPAYRIGPTDPEDMALLHFTSGTTGTPKAAVHVHGAVLSHYATGRMALDLHPDDIFWCTADPGWVTGTSYGIIAPLVHGVTSVVDAGDFDADRWYHVLESQSVTVWYTSPTALRMLMQAGREAASRHNLGSLRLIASVGEPLSPEVVVWGQEVLGLPIHDNWWQTETGGIMIANYPCMAIRPGSMGRPLPGVEAAILQRDEAGQLVRDGRGRPVPAPPGTDGELALKAGWPSMFRGYLGEEDRYRACFSGDWYLTGDLARTDEDGYFWFVGRRDDVIKTAGQLIGPSEVESVLMEHPAVAEAGVIGKPDPTIGETVKAFVTLGAQYEPSEDLRSELLEFARQRLGAAVAPREITFEGHLPHTRTGKIMRRLLRARETNRPEGDTSALEVAR